jgi:hypothetical protein
MFKVTQEIFRHVLLLNYIDSCSNSFNNCTINIEERFASKINEVDFSYNKFRNVRSFAV